MILTKPRHFWPRPDAEDSNGDGTAEINGRPLLLNMRTYETRASLKPALELVQVHLRRIGIASTLKVTKKGSPINQAMKKGRVHLNLQMWNAAFPRGEILIILLPMSLLAMPDQILWDITIRNWTNWRKKGKSHLITRNEKNI